MRPIQAKPRSHLRKGINILDESSFMVTRCRPRRGSVFPAFARRGECAEFKRSREATFEGRRRGGCVILRSFLIDARAAYRLKPFHKERFAGINKEAPRYYQPPRLRLQRNGSIFLMRSHPALQRRGLTLAPRLCVFNSLVPESGVSN